MARYKPPIRPKGRQMNMRKLNDILKNELSTTEFAQSEGLLATSVTCKCGNLITKYRICERTNGSKHAFFQCDKRVNKKPCRYRVSLRKGTIFENCKLKLNQVFRLIYCFTLFLPYRKVIKECSDFMDEPPNENSDPVPFDNDVETEPALFKTMGQSTVARYFVVFRGFICAWAITHFSDKKIGGPGRVVEIDESKFGKRKYHRGRLRARRDSWVLGGVDRESGEIFLVECPHNKRDRQTLIPIIREHVKEGTHIITDCWRAYMVLENYGYTHSTVNHSKNFVKPNTGNSALPIHTNRIEGQWWQVKRWLPDAGRYSLKHHFPVFMWMTYHQRQGNDLFYEMIKLIGTYNEKIPTNKNEIIDSDSDNSDNEN